MRKMICLIVVLALFFCGMAGCVQNQPTNGETTNGEVATGSENSQRPTNNSETNAPSSTPVVVIPPTAPENPGNTLIPFDPDREIYLLYANQNVTIQKDFTSLPSISVYIIAKDELDTNEISLELPAQSDYFASAGEIKLNGFAEADSAASRDQFSYALYQCYMGKDFAKLWELEKAYNACQAAYEKDEIGLDELMTAQQTFQNYRDAEKESYCGLTAGDLPNFHVYYANVMFLGGELFEETITQAQLRIGSQTHTLILGEITIKTQPNFPAELDWYNGGGYAYDGILGSGNDPLPYNDGIHRIESYFSFTAEHVMTLTDIKLDDPDHQLVAAWIEVSSASGGAIYELWDMNEPFLLMPGDRVKIHIAYREEAVTSLSYATKVWGYLIYEWDKGTSCKLSECDIRTAGDMNFYELYALIFEGLDIESYYRDYYYPKYESWRNEMN